MSNLTIDDNKTIEQLALQLGNQVYYALDSVKQKLLIECQEATNQMKAVLERLSTINEDKGRKINRGIITYLPPRMDGYAKEFKALYLSIGIMRTYQPANIKTDFIVFAPADGQLLPLSLGCTKEERNLSDQSEQCVVMDHIPTKDRGPLNDGSPDPLMQYAAYLDSINILAEFNSSYSYDYLMRVDLDTFLTPGFADWLPPKLSTLVVGSGGYGSNNANAHLKWVATNRLGLNDTGLQGLGSTWYGTSELMISMAKTTLTVMRWLHTQEFSEYEKCCSGIDGWPNWHWPVLLLYGGHIALNQLGPDYIQKSAPGVAEMDAYSTSIISLTQTIKHIHCWHTSDMFSKFVFHSGGYNETDLHDYMNMNSSMSYAATVAISSDRLTAEELKTYIANETLMKENRWIRQLPKGLNKTK